MHRHHRDVIQIGARIPWAAAKICEAVRRALCVAHESPPNTAVPWRSHRHSPGGTSFLSAQSPRCFSQASASAAVYSPSTTFLCGLSRAGNCVRTRIQCGGIHGRLKVGFKVVRWDASIWPMPIAQRQEPPTNSWRSMRRSADLRRKNRLRPNSSNCGNS